MTSDTNKSSTTIASKRENEFNRPVQDESLKVTKLTVSKKWELPAKPKPGRKPSILKDSSIISHRPNKLAPLRGVNDGTRSPEMPVKTLNETKSSITANIQVPSLDCGLCEAGGHCACDALGIKGDYPLTKSVESMIGLNFEPFEPIAAMPLKKRARTDEDNVRRIKSLFSNKIEANQGHETNDKDNTSIAVPDPKCGLCKLISTKCMCSDTPEKTGPGTPEIHLFSPGSCDLCQKDPMCTLFCVSLASAKGLHEKSSVTVSCSQSYLTLSRHRNFDKSDVVDLVDDLEADNGKVDARSVSKALRRLDKI